MKLSTVEKLRKDYINPTFESRNQGKAQSLYYLSFIGNILLIWWSSKSVIEILTNLNEFNFSWIPLVINLMAFILLIYVEISKRKFLTDLFKELYFTKFDFSTSQVKESLIFCLILIVFSSYMAINGSKLLTDKTGDDRQKIELQVGKFTDSLNTTYNYKVKDINNEISLLRSNITDKHNKIKLIEDRSISENRSLSPKEGKELLSYKNDVQQFETKINNLELSIKKYTDEKLQNVKTYNNDLLLAKKDKFLSYESNVFKSLLWSVACELLVMLGIFFNVKFNYNSLLEISNNDQYKNVTQSLLILKILFEDGKVKAQGKTITLNKLPQLCKLIDRSLSEKLIKEKVEVLKHLSIISTKNKGQGTLAVVDYETAKAMIKSHFNF